MTCPVCSGRISDRASVKLDYGAIYSCRDCGSGILLPRPGSNALADLHSNDDYFDHPYFSVRRTLTPKLAESFRARVEAIRRTFGDLSGKHILDIGCDTGLFVKFVQDEAGATASGVDVFERVVKEGRSAGLDLHHGTLEQVAFPDQSVDVVCAYDLIEHVSDPQAFVQEVARVLKPGGMFVLETPNYGGFVYRLGLLLGGFPFLRSVLRPYQARLWPAFHVQYFTSASLGTLLSKANMLPTEISGRELRRSELAIERPLLRAVVMGLFRLANATGRPTLLCGISRLQKGAQQ